MCDTVARSSRASGPKSSSAPPACPWAPAGAPRSDKSTNARTRARARARPHTHACARTRTHASARAHTHTARTITRPALHHTRNHPHSRSHLTRTQTRKSRLGKMKGRVRCLCPSRGGLAPLPCDEWPLETLSCAPCATPFSRGARATCAPSSPAHSCARTHARTHGRHRGLRSPHTLRRARAHTHTRARSHTHTHTHTSTPRPPTSCAPHHADAATATHAAGSARLCLPPQTQSQPQPRPRVRALLLLIERAGGSLWCRPECRSGLRLPPCLRAASNSGPVVQ